MTKLFKKGAVLCASLLVSVTMAMSQVKIVNSNLGVGINVPTQKLHVSGNARITGDVGIGTLSPTSKLHVAGNVFVDSPELDWGRALWTKVHSQYTCAYHLFNTFYNQDVFYVSGDGYAWAWKGHPTGSDIAFKKNITPIEGVLEKVISLQGARYQYKGREGEVEKTDEEFRLGFIAQDVEKIFPEVVMEMHDGSKAILYTDLIPVLVEAIKEQQKQIDNLQRMLSESCFSKTTPTLKSYIVDNEGEMENKIQQSKLYNNIPNPFSEKTEIRFEIPDDVTSAQLMICNLNGVELKSYNLTQKGLGSVIIQGSEFAAGIYLYTLLVNNQIVDTKKMILTK